MKKITFLILAFLSSLAGFAQLAPEGFEGTWTPNQGPPGWAILNIAGPAQSWQQAINSELTPSHEGTRAAYINRETMAPGSLTEDWLITPAFPVPANGQLKFWSRLFLPLDQGTLYKVMIGTSQTDVSSYTELTNWTELTLNTDQQAYEEKVVNIPASHVGQTRYIAFVMRGNNGDRWLVDDVSVVSQCFAPTALPTTNITGTSASLNWTDVAGSGVWEIEVVPAGTTPIQSGTEYNGTLPYAVSNLQPSTTYNYYVVLGWRLLTA